MTSCNSDQRLINCRQAKENDLAFILSLQKKFSEHIGFLPSSKTSNSILESKIFLSSLNDQEAGFLLFEPALSCQPTTAIIVQAAVCMDAQRQTVGLSLLHTLSDHLFKQGAKILQASCRSDLQANEFWKAAGFELIATRPGGKKRKKLILIWRKRLASDANLLLLPINKRPHGPGGVFAKKGECLETTLIF